MLLLPIQLWLAAVPLHEIEMPPRVVLGDAWNNPVLQHVPGRVDLEAALRGDGVPLENAHLVFLDRSAREEAGRLRKNASEVARWLHLADGTEQLTAEQDGRKPESCSNLRIAQEPLEQPELRLYEPPDPESSSLVLEAFKQTPIFAIGPSASGEGRVYAALAPGDQVLLVQAFSPKGEFGELIRLDRGEASLQVIRNDEAASLCYIQEDN